MKRIVPLYEVILLALLLIFAVYYFVLYQPTENELEEIAQNKLQTEALITEREITLAEKEKMQKEVDTVLEEHGSDFAPIPEYSNINTVIAELHAILGNTVSYSIDFDDEVVNSPIVMRDISIACSVNSYDSAMEVIRAVHDSPNACFIRDVTWSDRWADYSLRYGSNYQEVIDELSFNRITTGRYNLSMEVRCYEYAG